jgi:hypothetical protein
MKRNSLNFTIDLVSFINLLCLIFTGLIVKYILPPGSGGQGRLLHEGLGREHIKQFWHMSRHDWGNIHFYLAVLFVILMTVHIILHWAWIKKSFKSLFASPGNTSS